MRFFGFHVFTFHSFLSGQFVSNRYLKGQDGMVELDYVSDQKHLSAMNSMTVGSMIQICVITKAVIFHWQEVDGESMVLIVNTIS